MNLDAQFTNNLKKNTAESKGMTYGKHELDAVRKFYYGV
jgi:hypothetical protein